MEISLIQLILNQISPIPEASKDPKESEVMMGLVVVKEVLSLKHFLLLYLDRRENLEFSVKKETTISGWKI